MTAVNDLNAFADSLIAPHNPTTISISTQIAASGVEVSLTLTSDKQAEALTGFGRLANALSMPLRELTPLEKLHLSNLADRERRAAKKADRG